MTVGAVRVVATRTGDEVAGVFAAAEASFACDRPVHHHADTPAVARIAIATDATTTIGDPSVRGEADSGAATVTGVGGAAGGAAAVAGSGRDAACWYPHRHDDTRLGTPRPHVGQVHTY
jgi:hypothetical protein